MESIGSFWTGKKHIYMLKEKKKKEKQYGENGMKKGKSRGKFCPCERWKMSPQCSFDLHFLVSAVANLPCISELPVWWTAGDVGRSYTVLIEMLIGTTEEDNLAIAF